jgi:hypothetical protein
MLETQDGKTQDAREEEEPRAAPGSGGMEGFKCSDGKFQGFSVQFEGEEREDRWVMGD